MGHRTKNKHKSRHRIHENKPAAVNQLGRNVLRAAKQETTLPVTSAETVTPVAVTPPAAALQTLPA